MRVALCGDDEVDILDANKIDEYVCKSCGVTVIPAALESEKVHPYFRAKGKHLDKCINNSSDNGKVKGKPEKIDLDEILKRLTKNKVIKPNNLNIVRKRKLHGRQYVNTISELIAALNDLDENELKKHNIIYDGCQKPKTLVMGDTYLFKCTRANRRGGCGFIVSNGQNYRVDAEDELLDYLHELGEIEDDEVLYVMASAINYNYNIELLSKRQLYVGKK